MSWSKPAQVRQATRVPIVSCRKPLVTAASGQHVEVGQWGHLRHVCIIVCWRSLYSHSSSSSRPSRPLPSARTSPGLFAHDHSAGMRRTPGAQSERPARYQLRRARPLADYFGRAGALPSFENDPEARLCESGLDGSTPSWEPARSWVRVPALAMRTAQQGFLAFGVHGKVLATFWVLVLVLYGVLREPGPWFLMAWATLCCIGFLLSCSIDQTCVRSNSRRIWMTYASILPMLV